ncbi:DNA polymerase III subunit alpha [Candidatus Kaiserbacteria bacterium]|nr:DNA polymerase III subunit alpha [Candidatus Kaiserbacteria bacterium]
MKAEFVHLHTHSHFSLLEALPKIPELVAAAKKDGQGALALTDNGNMYAAIDFYKECKEHGIKPIIGVDFFVSPRTRHDKEHRVDDRHSRLVLLAKNETGYRNLIQLVTKSHLEGFYYRPRIDHELMEANREGLIAILPAFSGEHARALKDGSKEKSAELLAFYKNVFGANCFAEVTRHPEIEEHEKIGKQIVSSAREAGIPLVASHEVYYLDKRDALARELVNNIRTGRVLNREFEENAYDFSFISQARAGELFKDLPEALENSKRIADMCELELKLGTWVFPDFPVSKDSTHDKELRELAFAGFSVRNLPQTTALIERVEYELSIIAKKGYSPYFLVVADLLRHARDVGIYTNTRGSAAGSLVSYLCGITTVNPIEYNLPFERFLNPERPSPPDIDMDLADNRRDQLIDYVRQKYGETHVAQIGTFGTMMARAAVRDVARALGHSYGTGDKIAKMIPFGKQGFPVTIDSSLESTPELKDAYKKDADAREILDLARKIEGNARHVGVHAAGVVIAPSAVTDFVPIQRDPKGGKTITQYDMHAVEEAGLLKFDFLGLTNLSVLADSVTRVRERLGVHVDLDKISLEDKATYEMLSRGETLGVFQLAGGGMTNYLIDLKPSSIHDINAMVALYRPGPMGFIPAYIERKHNPKLVKYLDPRMEPILKNSYGVITYQDDVLEIAIQLAGYSWLEADKLRKAIGKKIPKEMAAQKEKLMKGAIEGGMREDAAEKLWQQIETFAAYGFNKCLAGDTRIYDSETGVSQPLRTMYDNRLKTTVYALDKRMRITSTESSAPFENGIKQVYKLRTRSGRTIRSTDNHPFRTFDGWTPLEKLQPGMRIAAPRRLPQPKNARPLASYKAAALGYLIAEGNLCHPHGVYFYSTQEDEIRDFIAAASQFSNTKISINRNKPATSVYVGQIDQKKGNSLRVWLSELGLANKIATEKFIPDAIFQADNHSLAILLGKMWQGDGCADVKNQLFYYATSSRRLSDDLQHLLLRFGIVSTIHAKQFKYRDSLRPGWTVHIHGSENLTSFMNAIGKHLIGTKRDAAEAVTKNSTVRSNNRGRGTADTVPAPIFTHIRRELVRSGFSISSVVKMAHVSERTLGYDARKKGYTRSVLTRIADALDSSLLRQYARSDIFWDEVVTIEPDGEEMTYDLTVPGPSNFVANGIFVHNSHAASYGNLAYKTAYMKANYPVDYMAAVLTADAGDVEKIAEVVAECSRMGLTILPPSVNESRGTFTVVPDPSNPSGQAIRFGLYSIKNFGTGVADSIITEREANGRYESITDFLIRIHDKNLNKKSLEALIMSGALDEYGERATLLGNIEILLAYHRESMSAPEGQDSLFGASSAISRELPLKEHGPATMEQRLAWEKELLGFYVSGHPLDKHKEKLSRQKISLKEAKEKFPHGVETVIAGFLETVQPILTKNGERMMFAKLADYSGSIEIVAFPRTLKENEALFTPGSCVMLKGKFSSRNGESSFVVDRVKAL